MIQVTKLENFGLSRNFNFSSESAPNYQNSNVISFTCFESDLLNTSGPLSAISALYALRETEDYETWVLAGATYERCKLESFDTIEGDLVNNAKVQISLKVLTRGQDNLTIGGEYGDKLGGLWQMIESIAETASVSRGPNSATYERTINITLNRSLQAEGAASDSEIAVAKSAIKSILDFDSTSGYTYDIYEAEPTFFDVWNDSRYKKIRTESHNAIANTVSISERLDIQNLDEDESHEYNDDIKIGIDGFVTITEKGKIQGLLKTSETSQVTSSISKYTTYETDIRARIQDIYDTWAPSSGESLILKDGVIFFIDKAFVINQHEGFIEYTITATDNPNLGGHTYILEISKDDCFDYASEQGTFFDKTEETGDTGGKSPGTKRHDAAYAEYKTQIATIDARIKARITCSMTSPYRRSESHNFREGSVSYKREFTNNPVYDNGLTVSGKRVKKYQISNSETTNAETVESSASVGNKPLFQVQNNSETSQDVNITMLLERIDPSTQIFTHFDSSKTLAKDKIDDIVPASKTEFLTEASMSWSPLNDVIFEINTKFDTSTECV